MMKNIAILFLGIIIGALIISFAKLQLQEVSAINFVIESLFTGFILNAKIILFIIIILAFGTFGGILHAMRSGKLQRLYIEHTSVSPGWLGDAAFGIAGALVVFLLLPTSIPLVTHWDIITACALAAVGGYGGKAILEAYSQKIEREILSKTEQLVVETKTQQARLIGALRSSLDREEYLHELERIIEKETPENEICLIYADVDSLKKHLQSLPVKIDDAEVRIAVHDILETTLRESAKVNRGSMEKVPDIFNVTGTEADCAMVLRGADIAQGWDIAEYARNNFKNRTQGNKMLFIEDSKNLTASFGVVCTKDQKCIAADLHKEATDILLEAKKHKNTVRPEKGVAGQTT